MTTRAEALNEYRNCRAALLAALESDPSNPAVVTAIADVGSAIADVGANPAPAFAIPAAPEALTPPAIPPELGGE